MNKTICFWFFFFLNGYWCHAQVQDTLQSKRVPLEQEEPKLNKETLEAIRKGALIGPEPERKKIKFPVDEDGIRALAGDGMKENLPDSVTEQETSGLRVNQRVLNEVAGLSRVAHRKTTVNDDKEMAYPHVRLSFEDILRTIFWPSHRLKMRNKKRAKAYETYKD